MQPDKCLFLKEEVAYLGHIISEEGVRPDPWKTQAVSEFPRSKNQKNIKQFLGLAEYYRRFTWTLRQKGEYFYGQKHKKKLFVFLNKYFVLSRYYNTPILRSHL